MDFLAEARRREQQQTAASLESAAGRDPEREARARKYAIELGLSPDIVLADFPRAEQDVAKTRALKATENAPATARFLADPGKAAVASDDVGALAGVEGALRPPAPALVDWQVGTGGFDVLKLFGDTKAAAIRLGGNVAKNYEAVVAETLGAFAAIPGAAEFAAANYNASMAQSQLTAAPGKNYLTPGQIKRETPAMVRSGRAARASVVPLTNPEDVSFGTLFTDPGKAIPATAEQALYSIPATAQMLLPGSGLALGVLQSAGSTAYNRADANKTDEPTAGDWGVAAPTGAAVAALDRLGAIKALGAFADGPAITALRELPGAVGKSAFVEGLTEIVQGLLEYTGSTVGTQEPFKLAQALRQMEQGAMTGAFMGGTVRSVTGAVEVLAEGREAATEAPKTGEFFDRLSALAEASKLRERDPASFQELVAAAAEEGGYAQDVYVSPEAFNAAFSTPEGAAALAAMPAAVRDAAEQASVTGDAVRIPVDEFTTYVAGTPVYEALKDHIKLDAGGMTRAEATDWVANEGDLLRSEIETRLTEQQVEGEFAASRQRVIDDLRSQLDTTGRFTSDINDIYASFAGHSVAVAAAKSGMTPEAFLQKHPFRVDAGDGAILGAADTLEQEEALTAPPVEADGMVRLTHWGSKAGLKSLNPKKWGKNADILSRQERQMAEDDRLPGRVYFGIGVGREGGYVPEHGLGKHRYTAAVRREDLYDYDADPMNLRNTRVIELLAEEGFDEKPDPDGPDYGYGDEAAVAYERAIVEAGFKGFWTGEQGSGLIGVLFEKPKVNYEGEDGEMGQPGRPAATLADFNPENVKDLLLKDGWAVLTAANPAMTPQSDAENAAANAMLKADLEGIGAQYLEAAGKYGSEEPSLAVVGITREQAQALGDKYRQDSVLTREGLIYGAVSKHPGAVQPALFVETYETPPADLYTEVPATGALFKVELDWDRLIEPVPEGSYAQAERRVPQGEGETTGVGLANNLAAASVVARDSRRGGTSRSRCRSARWLRKRSRVLTCGDWMTPPPNVSRTSLSRMRWRRRRTTRTPSAGMTKWSPPPSTSWRNSTRKSPLTRSRSSPSSGRWPSRRTG